MRVNSEETKNLRKNGFITEKATTFPEAASLKKKGLKGNLGLGPAAVRNAALPPNLGRILCGETEKKYSGGHK